MVNTSITKTGTACFRRNGEHVVDGSILDITLGNLLPSKLLQEMQRLNHSHTGKLPNRVIRSIHLSKLPASMQPMLDAVGSDKSDADYSVLADNISKRQLMVNGSWKQDVNQLTKQTDPLQELRDEVQQLKKLMQTYILSTQPTREGTASPPRDSIICYYHSRFGKTARSYLYFNATPPA